MKREVFYKAQCIGDSAPESVTLVFDKEFPSERYRTLADAQQSHRNQAEDLEMYLWETLPGGTYDALFAWMARRKASGLVVSHASITPTEEVDDDA